jgi:class 3 adenylate cyclase/pimeloyl-ACP methyl ester carboxylesterase
VDIRYATTKDGVGIAFWTMGEGTPLVVMPEPILSSIHADLQFPSPRAWHERLARDRLLIRFDHRGTGLSQAGVTDFSLPTMQLDLEAVVDQLERDSFNLWAQEDAGPIAIAFAAANPGRVKNLILWNTWARGEDIPESPALHALEGVMDKNWGLFIDSNVLSIWNWKGPEAVAYARELTRSTRQASWIAFTALAWAADVRGLLPSLRCRTLVMHRRDQPIFRVDLGIALAREIAGARLAIVEGDSQFPWAGDYESCAEILDDFLGVPRSRPVSAPDAPKPRRMLATVLFIDIVESTQQAARLGDRRWAELLARYRDLIRVEISRFSGHEVDTAGDGFLCTFEGPAAAILCATAATANVGSLGLQIRAGVHTGEVEVADTGLTGIAVHIGARVAGTAGPGEVLATSTVRDLAAGSGIRFVERGAHQLKGVPGSWTLYVADSD